ncbi:hypothetical protein [Thermobispora bispora]|uniref:hypothetical protein n=1 Tax=Thermobispora bispora TaxID=2006 RepID=UPI003B8A9470
MYERFHGPIPPGWEVDHLCHHWEWCRLGADCPHRACVNPSHWLAVPSRVNNARSGSPTAINARKRVCVRGHPLAGANLRLRRDRPGHRECRECARLRRRLRHQWEVATAGGRGWQLSLLDLDGAAAVPGAGVTGLGRAA